MALIKELFAGLAVLFVMAFAVLLHALPWAIAIALGLFIFRSCGG